MANNAPSTQFMQIPTSGATTTVDTPGERIAIVGTTLATNNGTTDTQITPWDFGTVDISAGAANSAVFNLIWTVTADNGNTTADNFRFWMSNDGFASTTDLKYACLSGPEINTTTDSNIDAVYVASATTGSYTYRTSNDEGEGEPTVNLAAADDTNSLSLSSGSTDGIHIAAYFAVVDEEKTGTYQGTTAGYELQCSLKFDFS